MGDELDIRDPIEALWTDLYSRMVMAEVEVRRLNAIILLQSREISKQSREIENLKRSKKRSKNKLRLVKETS